MCSSISPCASPVVGASNAPAKTVVGEMHGKLSALPSQSEQRVPLDAAPTPRERMRGRHFCYWHKAGCRDRAAECPLLGVRRASIVGNPMSAFDPKRKSGTPCCDAQPAGRRVEVDLCIAVFLVGFGDARASALMQPLWQSDFCWRWGQGKQSADNLASL